MRSWRTARVSAVKGRHAFILAEVPRVLALCSGVETDIL